jgi:uncharacterized protein YndB with AHSA1/START domain
MTTQTIPSVRRSVTVNAPVDKAFRVFTEGFASWWPRTHHIGAAELADAVLEQKPGGRWYEKGVDGSECEWGRVLAFEPPHRLVLSWQINGEWQYEPDESRGSEVEVLFTELGDGRTRVDLEHRELARHGEAATEMVKSIGNDTGGWGGILKLYASALAEAA